MKKLKRAQIQSLETIAILFVFFIIVFIGIIFYSNIARSNLTEKIDKYQELSKIQVVQIVESLPEVQCSRDNIVEPNCMDILKLSSSGVLDDVEYFDYFGFSRITIQEKFPDSANSWVFYDRLKVDEGKLASYFPISLFDPIEQEYRFGVLVVEVNP